MSSCIRHWFLYNIYPKHIHSNKHTWDEWRVAALLGHQAVVLKGNFTHYSYPTRALLHWCNFTRFNIRTARMCTQHLKLPIQAVAWIVLLCRIIEDIFTITWRLVDGLFWGVYEANVLAQWTCDRLGAARISQGHPGTKKNTRPSQAYIMLAFTLRQRDCTSNTLWSHTHVTVVHMWWVFQSFCSHLWKLANIG